MADSVTDQCNAALSEIGTRSTITSLEENSTEAINCKIWYHRLRRQLLRCAPWGFARMQLSLSELGDLIPDNTSPYPYLFKYAYPSSTIKFRYVVQPPPQYAAGTITPPQVGAVGTSTMYLSPSRANRYVVANDLDAQGNQRRVILTNVCQAIGVWTGDVTDPSLFDDLFSNALISSLAYRLVIPLSGNVGMKKDFQAEAENAILQARVADGNEAVASSDHTVDWIATRGVSAGGGFAFGGLGGATWGNWNCGYDNMAWGM